MVSKNKKVTKNSSTKIIILATLIGFAIQSCQYFNKPVSKQKLLQKELKTINWNLVDEYPSIADCESLDSKAQQKQCFFEFLIHDIHQKINTQNLAFKQQLPDTLLIQTTIFQNATLKFKTQNAGSMTTKADSVLQIQTTNLPQIKPATKRGMFVKTEFILPIKIKKTPKKVSRKLK